MGKRNGCHRTNVLHEPRNQADPVEPPGRPHARVTTTAELRAAEQGPLRRARSCNRHGGAGTPVRGDSRSTTSRNSGWSSSSRRRGGHYAARSWTHGDCGAGGEPEYPAKRAGWWPVEAGEVLRAHHVAGRPLRRPVYRLLHAVLSLRRADSLYRRRRTVQQIRRHHSTKLLWLWLMREGGRGRKRKRDLRRPGRERHKEKSMTC